MLIESGLYVPGSQKALDRAIGLRPALLDFLRQDSTEFSTSAGSLDALQRLLREAP